MDNNYYKEAYDKLKGYRQKQLFGTMTNGEMEYEGIELNCTSIVIDETVERLNQFFSGYNFKITGDSNSETITIK
jgi:hypothetical protein